TSLGIPFRQAAIEHRNGVVTDPAQEPPQPRSHCAVARVVADDLVRRRDAATAEPIGESIWIGQGMAAVASGLRRRQVAVEAREERAGDVPFAVLLLAELWLRQVVAAVEHPPAI